MKSYLIAFVLLLQVAAGQAQTPIRGLIRLGTATTSTSPAVPTTPTTPTTTPSSATAGVSNTPITAKVTIQYATLPSSTTYTLANAFAGKKLAHVRMKDDGGPGDWTTVYPYLYGGLGPDGVTYPGQTYTDGAGKVLKMRWTFPVNWNSGQISNATSSAKHLEMVQNGFADISNHSLTHAHNSDQYYDLKQNEINIYTYLGGYRTRTFTIPTDFKGFVEMGLKNGYKLITSQGFGSQGKSSDGNNEYANTALGYPSFRNVFYSEQIPITSMVPTMPDKVLPTRLWETSSNANPNSATDRWNNADLAAFKTWFDARSAKESMIQGFSHGPTYTTIADTNAFYNWQRSIQYVKNSALGQADLIWYPGLQEWIEYYECRQNVLVTKSTTGNAMVLNLDYANVDNNVRHRKMSFFVPPGATNVTVAGADSVSFNASTGLVNVYKLKIQGFTDPATDTAPPGIASATVNATDRSKIDLVYTRPVVTSNVIGYTLHYGGSAIPVTALSGSGKNWTLSTGTTYTTGQTLTLDYQLDANPVLSGNVADASTGQYGSTYWLLPVTN